MFRKHFLSALVVALITLPVFGQSLPNVPAAKVVKATTGGIDLPCDPVVKPPKPLPKDDSPPVLKPGQWWVAGHDSPLVIRQSSSDGGGVIITVRTGPLKLPAEVAIGRAPDKDDPEFVTIPGKYIYCVKCQNSGTVALEIVPALNRQDAVGNQIPLSESDFFSRKVLCDTSVVPTPVPPAPVPPAPNPPIPIPPAPIPVPPPPPPAPVMGKLWGYILIEDLSKPFPNRGPIVQGLDTYIKANGLSFRKFDVNVTTVPPDLVTYVAAYKKNPPPSGAMIYIIDANGKSFEEGPPKATAAEAVAQITKYNSFQAK